MSDCLIVGGGVVGLSIAWVLAREGRRVTVADRQVPGREASWAGAGILPPAKRRTALHPIEYLRAWSSELHALWSKELLAATGIDNGYHVCGGIYLARTAGEAASLAGMAATYREEQIECHPLKYRDLVALEPATLSPELEGELKGAYFVPEEAQLRNPRHLRALLAACAAAGVAFEHHIEIVDWDRIDDRIVAAKTADGQLLKADQFVVAGGAWSGGILASVKRPIAIIPIRGQMILYRLPAPCFSKIINEGSRYLVPRTDGHVLVGSTEEEVGFDKETTQQEMDELERVAGALVPQIKTAAIEGRWAGLRPYSFDGFPYIGRAGEWSNLFVATGHFRSGLHLSPATAMVIADLLANRTPPCDVRVFRPSR
jgi:glycine oxidase